MFFSKRKKNRKWNERPQLYRGRFFYLKQLVHLSLIVILAISVVALALYFKNSEALGIKSVEVLGDLKHLTKDEVVILSGIKKTDKLFTLSLGQVQKNIERFYWVKEVRVRREFPDKIQIYVIERIPQAILFAEHAYLIDTEGEVFKKLEAGDPKDLPILTGFSEADLKNYPRLMRSYFSFCLSMLSYLQGQDFYKNDPISEIHFDRVAGVTAYTKNNGLEIYYGRDDYIQKQKKLEKFKLSKQYEQIAFIRLDLDAKDKVIARRL